jgi:hypothetical protein
MNSESSKIGEEENIYCVDCRRFTWQKYKGVLADKTALFLCEDCGCENSEDVKTE